MKDLEINQRIQKLGEVGRFYLAQKLTGKRFYSGSRLFRGVEGIERFNEEIKEKRKELCQELMMIRGRRKG